MIEKLAVLTYAVLAYLAGTASLVALIIFLSGLAPALSVDVGTTRPLAQALLINTSLLALWTLQHIGMARLGFKKWLIRWLPEALERSTYVLFTGLSLGALLIVWSPIPDTLFVVTHPLGVIVLYAVFFAGWAFALAGIFYDSYLEFVGLKQAYCHLRGLSFTRSHFKTGFVFRLCRRPTFLGILIGCWVTPVMTMGHAFFAVGMTAFTITGCYFVERTYLRLYGDAYRDFQSVTPLLLPRLSDLWRRTQIYRKPAQ
jgi:protein-S-isoprenylcysteine O-methyltransferase Ste14